MNLDKLLILGPRKDDQEEAMERWKEKTEKLYFEYIFPYFKWNDLLRFRRVCKDAKELADKYIRTKGEKLCPEITIYERGRDKDKCLARFLELGFPATSIYIVNTSGSTMFEREARNFAKFAEQSGPGPKIIQLRLHQLNKWLRGSELEFFEALSNLKVLLVDEFGGQPVSQEESFRMGNLVTDQLPERFKQLRKVKLGVRPEVIAVDLTLFSRAVMNHSLELEYSADAYSIVTRFTPPFNSMKVLGVTFDLIRKYIEDRGQNDPTKPNLKYYDFESFHKCPLTQNKVVELMNSEQFLELMITCVKYSVKLLNVNSAWLQKWQPNVLYGTLVAVLPQEPIDPHTLSKQVVSMVNLHGFIVPMTMPNLEQLTIPATSRCSLAHEIWLGDRKPWRALKILDVTVDSKMLCGILISQNESTCRGNCLIPESTASLMHFLFVGIQRAAMTEVSLAFLEGVDVEDVTVKAATGLGACCPNLKKLTLVNWPGTNATLVKVLGDIKALEELCVDNCKKIGDLAFTRTDTTDGLIKQHPGLKKLSLKQLNKMPKLTDKLFQDVISKMKLSHLLLTSNKALSNITPDSITALKNGEFAKTIEKFPFTGWSLANVSKDDLKKIGKEFRSFNMN